MLRNIVLKYQKGGEISKNQKANYSWNTPYPTRKVKDNNLYGTTLADKPTIEYRQNPSIRATTEADKSRQIAQQRYNESYSDLPSGKLASWADKALENWEAKMGTVPGESLLSAPLRLASSIGHSANRFTKVIKDDNNKINNAWLGLQNLGLAGMESLLVDDAFVKAGSKLSSAALKTLGKSLEKNAVATFGSYGSKLKYAENANPQLNKKLQLYTDRFNSAKERFFSGDIDYKMPESIKTIDLPKKAWKLSQDYKNAPRDLLETPRYVQWLKNNNIDYSHANNPAVKANYVQQQSRSMRGVHSISDMELGKKYLQTIEGSGSGGQRFGEGLYTSNSSELASAYSATKKEGTFGLIGELEIKYPKEFNINDKVRYLDEKIASPDKFDPIKHDIIDADRSSFLERVFKKQHPIKLNETSIKVNNDAIDPFDSRWNKFAAGDKSYAKYLDGNIYDGKTYTTNSKFLNMKDRLERKYGSNVAVNWADAFNNTRTDYHLKLNSNYYSKMLDTVNKIEQAKYNELLKLDKLKDRNILLGAGAGTLGLYGMAGYYDKKSRESITPQKSILNAYDRDLEEEYKYNPIR